MTGQQPPKKKLSLFGKPKPEPVQGPDVTRELSSINGRLRLMEERLNNLNRKIEVDESNKLESQKKVNVEFKTFNLEFTEIKRSIEKINETMSIIKRELPNLAAKDELDVLKKYIELWEPVNFVTRNELDKRLKEETNK